MNKYRLFIVDDEPDLLEGYIENFKDDFEVKAFDRAPAALAAMRADPPHILITDYRMPDMDGIEFSKQVREEFKDIPVILISAYADKDRAIKALGMGIFDLLEKPFSMVHLNNTLRRACSQIMMEELVISLTAKCASVSKKVKRVSEEVESKELLEVVSELDECINDFMHRRQVLKELRDSNLVTLEES